MLVFRDAPGVPVSASACCARLRRDAGTLVPSSPASHDAAVSLLIEAGMLEAALADAADAGPPEERAVVPLARAATLDAARAVAASWHGDAAGVRRHAASLAASLDILGPAVASRTICPRTPEGYAYYGLYPEMYLEAARGLWDERRPRTVAAIGIRSIGTSLSAIAAAELERHGCASSSVTVRPTGHPYARELRPDAALASLLASSPDLVIVADEGPGLSGSSFAAALDFVARAGVAPERTVVLPAHDPDPSALLSRDAASAWRACRKRLAPFERTWIESGRLANAIGLTPCADLSAGRWRERFSVPASIAAVHPQHERRKYLAGDTGDRPYVLKFSGLGPFGEALACRAARLAGSAAAESGVRLAAGFIARPVVPGRPMTAGDVNDAFLRTAATYLGDVARRFETDREADAGLLAHMLEINARELLPDARLERLPAVLGQAGACRHHPAVELDARMLPHEWIRTGDGRFVKLDALEHHDDHFYPGPHDVAWDVAATLVEFTLPRAARDAFVARVETTAGPVGDRLEFFTAAYLAFRAAYCLMGAGALGDNPDAARLAAAGRRYRERLRAIVSR